MPGLWIVFKILRPDGYRGSAQTNAKTRGAAGDGGLVGLG